MTSAGVEHLDLQTDGLDRSLEVISELYTPVHRDGPQSPQPARLTVASHAVDGFRVDRLSHSTGYQLDAEPMDYVGVVMLLRGHASYTTSAHEVRFAPGRSVAFPAGNPLHVRHSPYDLRFVVVPAGRLAARAAELTGQPDLRLRLDLATTTSPADEARWRATVAFLLRELRRGDGALDGALFRENVLLLLMDSLLAAFPSNLHHDQQRGSTRPVARVSARTMHRATDYIHAHADRCVPVGDIATAAGVPIAELTAAFRRERDLTPAAYVRQVRLQGAEQDLQGLSGRGRALRPRDIRAILTRWGFSSPDRFSTLYREAFHVRPSMPTPPRSP